MPALPRPAMPPPRHRCSALAPCLALILGLLCALPAAAVDTLRVLTWPGYADPDIVRAFEARHGVRVEVSLISSDDVLWQKINANGGADFDVFAANTAEMQRYIAAGLLQPLQPANLPNTARQLPRFLPPGAIAGTGQDGKVYAIPYTYAEMGLIYDRRQFDAPPDSWAVLWDPRLRGRVLAFDGSSHNFSLAALLAGQPPFRIAPRAFPALIERLIALRRNVLTFYTLPEEAAALFRAQGIAVLFANYGSQQLKLLRDAGADVEYTIPREGALAWLDCWAITRGARNRALAERWIDYMLEAHVSQALTERQGLASTTAVSPFARDEDRLFWLEPVEDPQRRTALWRRIVSGDRPERFR